MRLGNTLHESSFVFFNPAVLLLSIVFLVTGCGPSQEEIEATRKKENDKIYFDKFNQEVISTKADKEWITNLNINRKNRSGMIISYEECCGSLLST